MLYNQPGPNTSDDLLAWDQNLQNSTSDFGGGPSTFDLDDLHQIGPPYASATTDDILSLETSLFAYSEVVHPGGAGHHDSGQIPWLTFDTVFE